MGELAANHHLLLAEAATIPPLPKMASLHPVVNVLVNYSLKEDSREDMQMPRRRRAQMPDYSEAGEGEEVSRRKGAQHNPPSTYINRDDFPGSGGYGYGQMKKNNGGYGRGSGGGENYSLQ
jgi:hypothetical protein